MSIKYDFIDLGCGFGTGTTIVRGIFGGGFGLGIDRVDEGRQQAIEGLGCDFAIGDVVDKIKFRSRFVSGIHILEHLKTRQDAAMVIGNAIEAATDFVFFNNPNFEQCEELHVKGFKFYWEEMADHTYHIKASDVVDLFKPFGIKFCVFVTHPAKTSKDADVWPLHEWSGGRSFDGSCHKEIVDFGNPIYKLLSVVAWKKSSDELNRWIEGMIRDEVLFFDGRE